MKLQNVPDFQPGEEVRAKLWPELGVGAILEVSVGARGMPTSRCARVEWETGQVSLHSFVSLRYTGDAVKIYYCPNSGEWERDPGGGFDTCCDAPDRHVPLPYDIQFRGLEQR
jgi:hypothetical protein